MKSVENNLSLYDSKVFLPILLAMALLLGFFQNCSSKFTEGIDPLEDQYKEQYRTAVIISSESVTVSRLEGTSLFIAPPKNLFSEQGLESCSGAKYTWSFSKELEEEQIVLGERSSLLKIDPVYLSNEGFYFLDVECNGQGYNLGPVKLLVVPKLRLINSNVTDRTVNEGSPVTLSGQFQGPDVILYQWYYQPDEGNRMALAGQTEQELLLNSVEVSNEGVYELEASSTEGGFSQNSKAGPGKLNVLSIGSVTGSVSGTTEVEVGSPIKLTSVVNGVASPSYQWRFNGSSVTGATQADFEIPQAQVSDEGVYSLSVVENSKTYQIGTLTVKVLCPSGEGVIDGLCKPNSKSCPKENGTGIQFLEDSGEYGECLVVSCEAKYVNVNNQCVSSTGTCPIENGEGTFTIDSGGEPGECVVQSCDTGFIKIENSCQQQACPVLNGVGLTEVDGDSLVCKIQHCYPGFVKYDYSCVPGQKSCKVENGSGYITITEDGPSECKVQSCNSGFVNLDNACVSSQCSVANGQGVLSLAANGAIQCRAISCNPGFFLSNNQCVSQTCSKNGGAGMWIQQNGQMMCRLYKCESPNDVIINNKCIKRSCPIANGAGAVSIDENGVISCKAIACLSSHALIGNECVASGGQECPLENGMGITTDGGQTCTVQSCDTGYVAYKNACVKERQSCSVNNGVGEQIFTSTGPGPCRVTSCNQGYTNQANQCVAEVVKCYVKNGQGYQNVYANGMSQCVVESCNPGYGITITQQCLPLKRRCFLGSGKGFQYLTSYGYTSCQIDNCPAGQSLINGACRGNEKLLCEPTDPSKSAYGGKVFGFIYSLLNDRYNANVNTATEEANRLNGFVYLNKVSMSGKNGYLYDVSNKKVQHQNGSYLKNWFGLKLHTQILPPDGATSGNYLLALASDDGSSLDCKVNGSWRTYINNNGANSCNNLVAASKPVYITKDAPMPVRVNYFQNSGAGRCLKLLYKRAGTSDAFKVIPKTFLMLPHNTVNNCPDNVYN